MPLNTDFEKILGRFTEQYGPEKGRRAYNSWLQTKGYDDTKPFPKSSEKKEKKCFVIGLETKEMGDSYHVEGLIATDHIDDLDLQVDIDIPDLIPKETLVSFANQLNTLLEARVMGVHHSEGRPINPRVYGQADVENRPAEVIELSDGHFGVYVDTVLDKNDPETKEIINQFESGILNSFSITYDTQMFSTTDFDWVDGTLVRILQPETKLYGYTAASNPVNPNAIATAYGYKEFKEMVGDKIIESKKEDKIMAQEETKEPLPQEESVEEVSEVKEEEAKAEEVPKEEVPEADANEAKEFAEFKAKKKLTEEKEFVDRIVEGVVDKMEVKEKVLKDTTSPVATEKVSLELKEFKEVVDNGKKLELKEQARRAAAYCDSINLDWKTAVTPSAESREFKSFGVNGTELEFKGLGMTTNQNSDTDYLQSTAELQDIYDPIIYNALNQETATWNLLAKDDFSKKGNNQVQFTLKTAANASATFYNGNSVSTDNVTRLKYQTKFKKLQVGVSVDGDMIAAARGGPVSDVFAQEVVDSTMDMMAVLNAALFAEVGLETASAIIGFEYITDSAGNTTLYSLTRSSTNKLSPDSAADTYIDGGSAIVSMTNLRSGIRQARLEGANKRNLVYITNPVQGDLLRSKFDDSRRMVSSRDTDFGFSTDLFVDGVPVFEDKDCNTDDWFLVDLETHRVAIWVPATIERLGKLADSEDAYIKMYLATYNRAPRRMVQIYSNATS